MLSNRRRNNVLTVAAAAVVAGFTARAGAQTVNETLSNWNLDPSFNSGESLVAATPNAPVVTTTEGDSDALVASFTPTTLSVGQAITFSGTIAFPSADTGGIQFRIGIMNPGASNSPPPPTSDTGWLGYLAEIPNGSDGLGNLGAREDIATEGSGAWLSGTGLANLSNQAGTSPGVNAPGIGTGATPITNNFTVTIVYNGGSTPSYFAASIVSTDGTYTWNSSGIDPGAAGSEDQSEANNVYSEVGFLFGSSTFGGSFSSGNTSFSNLAVTLGPAPVTWDNANATGTPADGQTWDVSNNYNWDDGTRVYQNNSAVTFNDHNNSNYNVTLNSTVTPGSVTVNNSAGNYSITGTGNIVSTGSFTKSGTGSLTVGTGLTAGSFSITNGSVMLATNTTLGSSAPGTSNVNLSSLSIAANSVLDITNNHIIIDYTSSDPMAAVYGYLQSGYNNGGWNGPGIISSAIPVANANSSSPQYGIGFSDGNDKINGHSIVSGLASGEIELKYTLLGDANLDGTVNGADFSILAANFGQGYTNWDQGNFLFTPAVNGADFSALAHNFGQGDSGAAASVSQADIAALDAFAAANGLSIPTIAAVPEPATIGLLSVGSMALLARRRNRKTGE